MPTFIPFEYPKTSDGEYFAVIPENRIFFYRREQLGMTQQQVAERAQVPLRQYQRLENGESTLSGNSMKTGLAICAVLMLDPYSFVPGIVDQPDPVAMKPVPRLDFSIPDIDAGKPRKAGRKPIRRDIMSVYVNNEHYSILIPHEVLESLGSPSCIQVLRNIQERRIIIRPVTQGAEKAILDGEAFDVPNLLYEGYTLAFPGPELIDNVKTDLGWDDEPYVVECRLVRDRERNLMVLADLNTAKPSEKLVGPYVIPSCLDDGADDFEDEEDSEDEEL